MKKFNVFILASAFAVILWHHLVTPVPAFWQWLFLGITILFSGVPHGALDHLVARKTSDVKSQRFHRYTFYLKYLSRMLAFGALWYISPAISLLIFLFISAFHFGETDIPIGITTHRASAVTLQVVYGFLLLLILLFAHTAEVNPLISEISGEKTSMIFRSLVGQEHLIKLSSLSLFALSIAWYLLKNKPSVNWSVSMLLQTLAIIAIITLLPLPLAFAFYFGCWHSLNALQSIRNHLSSSLEHKISWPWMIQQLLPYTAIAFLGIIMLIALITISGNASLPTAGFLIGIAVLTAPHFEVMSEMYGVLRK